MSALAVTPRPAASRKPGVAVWLRATRPRQWPKHLLVALCAVSSMTFGLRIGIDLAVAFVIVAAGRCRRRPGQHSRATPA